jgi:putative ABC transport system permease protein
LRDFTKWVLIANVIAWPIGYYTMKQWLKNFAYRTDFDWSIFLLSGVITLLIAVTTVGFKSLRAATANPVDSLRYE